MKQILLAVTMLVSTPILAAEPQSIHCDVSTKAGSHLASETSSLARGVDLTEEKGFDFFGFIDGRTDKRTFRIETYRTGTDDLVSAKSVSYYRSPSAKLSVEQDDIVFACEMNR